MTHTPANALKINIELRWSDQDAFGHVNNAKLMTLMEEAGYRASSQLQAQANYIGPRDPVVRTAYTDFRFPVHYTGPVTVNVWISRIGTTSYVLQHQLQQNDRTCMTMEAVMVLFDTVRQKSIPIPAKLRTAMETMYADNPSESLKS